MKMIMRSKGYWKGVSTSGSYHPTTPGLALKVLVRIGAFIIDLFKGSHEERRAKKYEKTLAGWLSNSLECSWLDVALPTSDLELLL